MTVNVRLNDRNKLDEYIARESGDNSRRKKIVKKMVPLYITLTVLGCFMGLHHFIDPVFVWTGVLVLSVIIMIFNVPFNSYENVKRLQRFASTVKDNGVIKVVFDESVSVLYRDANGILQKAEFTVDKIKEYDRDEYLIEGNYICKGEYELICYVPSDRQKKYRTENQNG